MKTPEDEAFEDIERRQGGFQSKRKMVADKLQEPVGMLHIDRLDKWLDASLKERKQREWVGITPENILALFDEHNLYGSKLVEFARAVEAKLKDKNNKT